MRAFQIDADALAAIAAREGWIRSDLEAERIQMARDALTDALDLMVKWGENGQWDRCVAILADVPKLQVALVEALKGRNVQAEVEVSVDEW
jgi:hypothetical protein